MSDLMSEASKSEKNNFGISNPNELSYFIMDVS